MASASSARTSQNSAGRTSSGRSARSSKGSEHVKLRISTFGPGSVETLGVQCYVCVCRNLYAFGERVLSLCPSRRVHQAVGLKSKGVLLRTPLGWRKSNGGGFQSFDRRSWCSILASKGWMSMVPHSKCALGVGVRSSFGPNSTNLAQIWPGACVPDPNCSEPSRGGHESA